MPRCPHPASGAVLLTPLKSWLTGGGNFLSSLILEIHTLEREKEVTVTVFLRNTNIGEKEMEASLGALQCKGQQKKELHGGSWRVQLPKERPGLNAVLSNRLQLPATPGKPHAEGASVGGGGNHQMGREV